jgi:hypothetical protein
MDMFGQLIPESGRRAMEGDMYEQMLKANGADMNRVIASYFDPTANEGKGGEVQLTAQQALDAYRKGPEDTPEVKAYKEAVNVQANAALELGRLATVAATTLIDGSKSLFEDLKSKLPDILKDAFSDVRGQEEAGAKPAEADKPPVVPPPTGASTAGTTPPPPLVSADTRFRVKDIVKDKNNVEIYDGDIVEWKDYLIGKIYWSTEDTAFIFKSNIGAGAFINEFYMSHFEVIGNIFENPELIENHKV